METGCLSVTQTRCRAKISLNEDAHTEPLYTFIKRKTIVEKWPIFEQFPVVFFLIVAEVDTILNKAASTPLKNYSLKQLPENNSVYVDQY